MKKIILTVSTIILFQALIAQSWINPQKNGLHYYGSVMGFTVPITPITTTWVRPILNIGSGAQLNDYTSGIPIFTSNGANAYNATSGAIIPSGTGLLGGNSSTTPATIVAMDSMTGYLITTSNITGNNFVYYSRYLTGYVPGPSYSPSIDPLAKNIQLFRGGNYNRFLEKTTIIRRPGASGNFWLILHAIDSLAPLGSFFPKSNKLCVFKGDISGITHFADYNLGTMVGIDKGQMKSTKPDASGNCFIAAAYLNERKIDVYRFNAITGNMVLHGIKNVGTSGIAPFGLEFSNGSNNYIYFTNIASNNSLWRMDYLAGGMPIISAFTGAILPKTGRFGQMQIMADNNIYFPIQGRRYVLQLTNPSLPTAIFSFTTNAALNVFQPLTNARYGIPNFNRE